jgi:hypothetical protein
MNTLPDISTIGHCEKYMPIHRNEKSHSASVIVNIVKTTG